ncbi:MAG: hypothetical protein IKT09_05120 [Synergistes sp.]|nr:hypothetical protein [Synergistes sp.]
MKRELKDALYCQLTRGMEAIYEAEQSKKYAAKELLSYSVEMLHRNAKYAEAKKAFFALLRGAEIYAPEEEGIYAIDPEELWECGLEEVGKICGVAALDAALERVA